MSVYSRLPIIGIVFAAAMAAAGGTFAAIPGTQYPSQKIVFTDPVTGRTVWRMTTDGATLSATHGAAGDQSSESRSFSPDSTRIVYSKHSMTSGNKPQGVYMMDVITGVETFLAPSERFAQPVWSRDGSNEVYYYDRPDNSPRLVRAVNTVTYAARTIIELA